MDICSSLRATSELGPIERAMVVAAANQCRHAATRKHQPWRDVGPTQKCDCPVAVQRADTATEGLPAGVTGDRGRTVAIVSLRALPSFASPRSLDTA